MRQIEQILENMDAVQADYPAISTINSLSNTGFFVSMRQMWARLHQQVEGDWDLFAASLDARLNESKAGGLAWYVDELKLFQLGDAVDVIDGKVAYAVVDAEKQIIKQSTVSENDNGRLTLRAAKKGISGLAPLTADELNAAKSYAQKFKMAGVIVDVTSLDADHLKLTASVKVDRQIISQSGLLLSDGTTIPVEKAINVYLSTIPFDSVINNTALTDAIQKLPGVLDFTITGSFIRRPYMMDWTTYNSEVVSTAGHGVLHADSILTYIY